MSAFGTVAPEQTGFELERFQWAGDTRLEVEGRWFGVRGRRFVRPVLTVQVRGRRRRLLALLEHKPWSADEGEPWIAAFPWEGSKDEVGEGELEVGALTVDLPPPGGAKRGGARRKREEEAAKAAAAPAARDIAEPAGEGDAPAAAAAPAFADDEDEPDRRTASETRHQVERDLAGVRAELGRLRQRHETEARELRTAARQATERLGEVTAEAAAATERAEQAGAEAARLREELEREREGAGAELEQLRESEAEARAEADGRREEAGAAAAEADRLRESAAEADELREQGRRAAAEIERLREAEREAAAENQRLRQAGRKAAAEAERLRAASRRPGGVPAEPRAPAKAEDASPDRPASPDSQATVPYQVLADDANPEPTVSIEPPRTEPEVPRGPPPSVRRIPREPASRPAGEDPARRELAAQRAANQRLSTEVERLRGQAAQAPPARPEPGAGAARLLGEEPRRRLDGRTTVEIWGPRILAIILVALLLLALALIVRGML